ncbi:MAG: HlyC/CorC family transporter [Bacilli bacterium]|nr:HlyC/CorC family transporter [Bacilli bacterium]
MNTQQVLILVYSISLVILLFLSFVFSNSDMAYGSVNLSKLALLRDAPNSKKANAKAYKLAANYDKTISTVLFLNDIVNAGLDSISTLLGVNIAILLFAGAENINQISETWGLVASLICLIFKITFGEIVAKSIGKIYNTKLSIKYANVINVLYYIFYPLTFVISSLGNLFAKLFGKNIKETKLSEDELHEMVDEIEEDGLVDEEKAEILHGTIDYAITEAYEIMTPRVEVYAIEVNDNIDEVLKDEELFDYSRIPVYEETIDNIIGYVLVKDLVRAKLQEKDTSIKDLLMSHLVFPRSTEINDILKQFKTTKKHFAVILDEYGGTEGVLTMEDILEEIVGEIWDESDDHEEPYVKAKNGAYIVDGQMNLEDFCELFEINYDDIDTEYVTIAGYCIELLDDNFAKLNQVIEFEDLQMKVIAIDDKHTIQKLKVKKNKKI